MLEQPLSGPQYPVNRWPLEKCRCRQRKMSRAILLFRPQEPNKETKVGGFPKPVVQMTANWHAFLCWLGGYDVFVKRFSWDVRCSPMEKVAWTVVTNQRLISSILWNQIDHPGVKGNFSFAKFLTSCHERMHRVIFYISNALIKLMIGA